MEKKINAPKKMKLTKDGCRSVKVEPGKSCADSMFQYDEMIIEKVDGLIKLTFKSPASMEFRYLDKSAVELMMSIFNK